MLVAPAHATDRAAVGRRINAKRGPQPLNLRLPLRLRELGAEVGHLGQEGCSSQGRIGADGAALALLLQGSLALPVSLQRTKGPNGTIAQGVNREAVFLGGLGQNLLGILT